VRRHENVERRIAHAFWLQAPGRGEICPVDLPEPGPADVVVRTREGEIDPKGSRDVCPIGVDVHERDAHADRPATRPAPDRGR
jgi:hypothetical protein